ncbi:hypothetical protein D7C21_14900 [Salmonella enterica]|nr:hypothetical protein [Salmonella enterica]EBI9231605.1 hypothetical protein [Salmonella enterica]
MTELLDIGNCLIDANLVVAVEPHTCGRNNNRVGALIRLSGGEVVIEEASTLGEVKAAIQAARKPAKPFAPHVPRMPPRHP